MESDHVADIIGQIVGITEDKKTLPGAETAGPAKIAKIAQDINTAYHRDWEKQKLEFARHFLSRTWAGILLPVLSLCGHGTQEIRYSKYLSFFLDGSKPHGLGTRYLDRLLELVGEDRVDTYKAVVESEKWIGRAEGKTKMVNCYCDIVISCDHTVIFIEQKIKSGESIHLNSKTTQLARYDEAIAKNAEFAHKKQVRIYLTPTGKISEKSPTWSSVSYSDLVNIGIDILHEGGLSGMARDNLKRFLLDLILGPFDKTESEIEMLVELAEKAVMSPSFTDRLKFDRMASRNKLLIELIMEG